MKLDRKFSVYETGFKNGITDHKLGLRLDAPYYGQNSLNEYVRDYSDGYRDGWNSVKLDVFA